MPLGGPAEPPASPTSTDDSDVGADDRFWRDRPRAPLRTRPGRITLATSLQLRRTPSPGVVSALSMRTVMTSEMTCWTSTQRRAQSPLTEKSQRSTNRSTRDASTHHRTVHAKTRPS
ncbi:hypothetical protein M5D96_011217 [Drosophila gunungcola]|uniref:Uncharacterized protein n=1 Tax=Drosophila gunungcola TaxID=103775 RepID=A0A9P9YFR5_9MUSC|nr:hypothetical protein M5D96_011217 [Drosophila gunungcola]